MAAGLSACGHTPADLSAAHGTPDLSFATGHWSIRPSATLRWQRCPGTDTAVRCARLTVPADYARPHGRKIALALVDFPATAPASQRLGPLIVDPGGPGDSGMSLALTAHLALPRTVASRYDIIGFDPRGVGHSQPQLSCDPSISTRPQQPIQPASKAAERLRVQQARAYAAACEQKFGWLLPHMSTADNARDMDAIRAALGVPKMSYLGYSWGTYLGEVYATLFPGHVRRMVLDSIVGPGGMSYQSYMGQRDRLFQDRLTAFFAWTAQHDDVYRLGRTGAAVEAQYRLAQRRLAAHPVPAGKGPGGALPPIGPDGLAGIVVSGAGYEDVIWPATASTLANYLHHGKTSLMAGLSRLLTTTENGAAAFGAVACSDTAWPRNWARWDADTRRAAAAAPWLAWEITWGLAPCAFWPVHGPAASMRIGAKGLPGILLVQGTLDAATPYAGALAARRALSSARLVVVTGGGTHGQTLALPADGCADRYLARYLTSGALPSGTGLVSATCAAPAPMPAHLIPDSALSSPATA